jgi:ribosomal protein S18 acetylase RimI-like enzyme
MSNPTATEASDPRDIASRTVIVQRLGPEWIGRAADVLALSFADAPELSYILGGTPRRRRRVFRPFFRGLMWGYWPVGEAHGAMLDGQLAGVGLRFRPGRWPVTGWHLVRGMAGMFLSAVPMLLALPHARRWFALEAAQEERHPNDRPHWYLAWVGVHPAHRRRGIATALARYVIEQADSEGVGCYMETYGEGTEALYRRLGFEILGTWEIDEHGPMGRAMWREPQAGSDTS